MPDLPVRRPAARTAVATGATARAATDVTPAREVAPVRVAAILVAPGRRLPVRAVAEVEAEAGVGLVGDRYHGSRHRHVSVQSADDLAAASAELGRTIEPWVTRRNLTLSHGPVPTAPGARLRIGDVELEVVRPAAPCRLLDDDGGPGTMRALHWRGGAICRLLTSGTIRLGDHVETEGG